jgi:5-methylcytosine-specific restriction endonuclease McrA
VNRFYSEYMKSDRWRRVRERRIFKDRGMCFVCGSRHNLEVHHVSYRNLGRERMRDLITLCREHHRMFHKVQRLGKKIK